MSTVAFLGLGRMGAPMAANLVAAGHDVVVWNRTTTRAEAFAAEHGCSSAPSPAAAASGADVVVTMLADDDAVRSALTGAGGALSAIPDGSVVVDMSTVGPTTSRDLGHRCAEAGAGFLDAPVSGSTRAATDAALTILVGGAASALEQARPVLDSMGRLVLHLGEQGSGTSTKLAVNAVVHALNNAVAEALVLAERAGVPREQAYEVFANSAIAAPFVHYRRDSFLDPDQAPVLFALDLAVKDVRLALELADEVGAPMPQAARNLEIFSEASAAGLGERDESAVAEHLRQTERGA